MAKPPQKRLRLVPRLNRGGVYLGREVSRQLPQGILLAEDIQDGVPGERTAKGENALVLEVGEDDPGYVEQSGVPGIDEPC